MDDGNFKRSLMDLEVGLKFTRVWNERDAIRKMDKRTDYNIFHSPFWTKRKLQTKKQIGTIRLKIGRVL